ncbi:unnamed protein product [Nezara viridula]|uniref:Uncharacterized protein n=1 Tax=Nezara viridula TaxID=85310 RepID=A0A9P0HKE0_NEZVI|nr:unnamed protein product [Nezara viridula]
MAPQPPRPEATWKPRWSYASSTDSSLLAVSSPLNLNRIVCFVVVLCVLIFGLGIALAFIFNNKETTHHEIHSTNLTDYTKYVIVPSAS